jgi:uncharacterized phage protein (TIGR02218 family)
MVSKSMTKSLRLATCWQITRTDNTIYRFTDHNHNITYNEQVYYPAGGFERSSYRKEAGLKSQSVEFDGVLSDSKITEEDIRKDLYRDARVDEYLVDWMQPWAGYFEYNVFFIISVTRECGADEDEGMWRAETAGYGHYLKQKIGRNFTRRCGHTFGDSKCTMSKTFHNFEVTSITGYDPKIEFECDASYYTYVDDYFRNYVFEWTTGDNTGIKSIVLNSATTGGTPGSPHYIKLTIPLNKPIQVGDDFKFHDQCNYEVTTVADDPDRNPHGCSTVGNIINYGGQPYMPGMNDMVSMPDSKV